MQTGKFNMILDAMWGSSGKGLMSTWLADHFNAMHVSSSNMPNAGHTAAFSDGTKFVAKAIPTSAILKKVKNQDLHCWLSPASGFRWDQLIKEWDQTGRPRINIHSRASIVTDEHKEREQNGNESTKHLASTMQGTAAAIVDKILRKENCVLAGRTAYNKTESSEFGHGFTNTVEWVKYLTGVYPAMSDKGVEFWKEFIDKVTIVPSMQFRDKTHELLHAGNMWLHEGTQGYALAIDHGSHFPYCTSRNTGTQAFMDHMAIPPKMVGDVYLNLRTYPIRVGNVVENGQQQGYSGDGYSDCIELNWEQVAQNAGMPVEEAENLKKREFTTVTGRLRRVFSFSWMGLKDAVKVNGATHLCVNFIQYINWKDRGLKGGIEAFNQLSKESREFIDKIEKTTNLPVVLIGTGALHDEVISLYGI